ncbi:MULTISPECIES: glycosyltransferase family 4 protein [unclassified Cryobacterium]|uniref:glycosyltransferase family 4 protein n=1 Tax=unclassified Cryobacterium TaxID=2649013 RepID=UPI002AB4E035|nr:MULTISPECIES: glycosyltransferase family 4 protein [unclassified Cryobacterium]MDY7542775.1 glycosyltransferase family 4 protein [Cryobacterium sp. 5B3]MEB0264852.1 glycosyltransferase family 4 protein [Cryobacterium sp. 10I5]MEB0273995.1 glycosyltransferase family 4 protein [Cryobacterium sp. 5B3]
MAADLPKRSKILIVTPDTIGTRMAGPAIRAWEIARVLSDVGQVRLASTIGATGTHPDFDIVFAAHDALQPHAAWADVIITQGHILRSHPWLKDLDTILVADIYDPLHLEQLEQGKDLPEADRYAVAVDSVEVMNDQMERADFMLCASEKQRDFWLGQLAGLARINPATYDQDPTLRSLLDVAPFGIAGTPPVQTSHGIRGVVDGIGMDDKIILWGGGIYNWFDPLSLIEAVARIAERHDNVRLFFLGVKHPNPDVPQMEMERRARELATDLNLINRSVFFNETWVPYEQRANFLLDADVGVSTHFPHIETQFSFRTRLLDYLWASLPIVSTDGDIFADLIRQYDLGATVPAEDVDALVEALEAVLFDETALAKRRERVQALAETMTWSKTLLPLVAFCTNPRKAADREYGVISQRNQILADVRKRLAGVETSSSWRVTAPLRWAGRTIAGLRKR